MLSLLLPVLFVVFPLHQLLSCSDPHYEPPGSLYSSLFNIHRTADFSYRNTAHNTNRTQQQQQPHADTDTDIEPEPAAAARYVARNKPAAIAHWLQQHEHNAQLQNATVLIIDSDMYACTRTRHAHFHIFIPLRPSRSHRLHQYIQRQTVLTYNTHPNMQQHDPAAAFKCWITCFNQLLTACSAQCCVHTLFLCVCALQDFHAAVAA